MSCISGIDAGTLDTLFCCHTSSLFILLNARIEQLEICFVFHSLQLHFMKREQFDRSFSGTVVLLRRSISSVEDLHLLNS